MRLPKATLDASWHNLVQSTKRFIQAPSDELPFKGGGLTISGQGAYDRDNSDILVSIVNYRTAALCIICLGSLVAEKARLPAMRVVVADGASGDGSVEEIEAWIGRNGLADWISVLPLAINGGFGWAHNQVMLRALRAERPPAFIHLLNPDTQLESGAVSALRSVFDGDPRIGCVGSQLINASGGLQPAGFHLPRIRSELARGGRANLVARALGAPDPVIPPSRALQEVPAVSGASFMVRVEALRQVGMFDHGFFLYFEEFEWMHRFARHGWKILYEPRSRVHHIGGAATKLSRDTRELARAPRPFYWYESLRRCLYRTHGPGRARVALLAWLAGYVLLALPRAALSEGFRSHMVRNEAGDMLRAWNAPEAFEWHAHIAYPGDPIGLPPAWQLRSLPYSTRQ